MSMMNDYSRARFARGMRCADSDTNETAAGTSNLHNSSAIIRTSPAARHGSSEVDDA